jgi:uncharacterized protein (TIGR02145 family)
MKMMIYLLLVLSIMFVACEDEATNPNNNGEDPNNNTLKYDTVTIGGQVWMKRNLDVDHYRNGDSIPQVINWEEWDTLTTGAWCYYDNDPANGEIYGKLYNWYAVNDPRGLAPEGWHISSIEEWQGLINYLKARSYYWCGNDNTATAKALAADTLWFETAWECAICDDLSTNNSTGFTALPGGYRRWVFFVDKTTIGSFWTSSEYDSLGAKEATMRYNFSFVGLYHAPKVLGFSVRCIRD